MMPLIFFYFPSLNLLLLELHLMPSGYNLWFLKFLLFSAFIYVLLKSLNTLVPRWLSINRLSNIWEPISQYTRTVNLPEQFITRVKILSFNYKNNIILCIFLNFFQIGKMFIYFNLFPKSYLGTVVSVLQENHLQNLPIS